MAAAEGYAHELVGRAATLLHEDLDAAERLYCEALELDPTIRQAWFDLALVHKWRREWEECLACNRHAMTLAPALEGNEDPAAWDAGIAATALHDWAAAREAWRHYGLDVGSTGSAPVEIDLGPGVVRLEPNGTAECVWGRRIDPARIQLTTVPFPATGHRWGDVVLHDGEARGQRVFDGKTYPVFDELERWSVSDVPTVEAVVSATAINLQPLLQAVHAAGWSFVNWSTSVDLLCPACSWGDIHAGHRHPNRRADAPQHIGIAGPPDAIDRVVQEWERWRRDRRVIEIRVAV